MNFTIDRDGQSYGPYTQQDLERYLASGHVLPTDRVRSDTNPEWTTVAQFFGQSPPPPPMPDFSDNSRFRTMMYGGQIEEKQFEFPWFPVSPLKFILMSLCTLGLYQVYWAYKNWNRIAGRTREGMMVWARAIFLGIWNFPLFRDVKRSAVESDIPVGWSHIFLAVCVLVLAICSRLPGRVPLLSLLSFAPYLPVVMTIEKINRKQAAGVEESLNTRFSAWNIAGLVFGGLLLLLVLVGFIIGPQPAVR